MLSTFTGNSSVGIKYVQSNPSTSSLSASKLFLAIPGKLSEMKISNAVCGVFLGGASYWATISKLISHFSISSIFISVRLRNLYSWSISPLKNVIKSGSPSKLNVTGLPFFTVTVLPSKLTLLSVTTPTSIAVSSFNSLSHEARDSPAKAIVIKLLYIVFMSFSF